MTGIPPFLTIAEAGRLIAAKKLSPVELAKALLAPRQGGRSQGSTPF